MNKRIKLLAASAVVGLQALPGYVSVAHAQSQLPLVMVTGQNCGGDVRVFEGGTFRGCTSLSNLPGGGGGGGSAPEGEAWVNGRWGFAPPPPPPKSAEQKAAEKAKCESDRVDSRNEATTLYTSNMAVCASSQSTILGVLQATWQKYIPVVYGYLPMDCPSVNNRLYNEALQAFDVRRNSCVAAAERD